MKGLTFRSDQDFEEICCYLMKDWVVRKTGHDVYFRQYGGSGQKQFGIDIAPIDGDCSIYGQAKFVERLSSKDIDSELVKTDSFPYPLCSFYYCKSPY